MSAAANRNTRFIDPVTDKKFKRGIFNAIIAPRPIGWISTVNSEGVPNLAPFSYFAIVSNSPAILVFSCNTPEDRATKDTAANVKETGEFVYNMASLSLVQEMNATSTPVPADVDEFEFVGLERAACKYVKAPRVAASPVNLECKVLKIVNFGGEDGNPQTQITFGEVIGIHIQEEFLDADGYFDTAKAQPVTRLGGIQYAVSAPVFELPRQFTRAREASY